MAGEKTASDDKYNDAIKGVNAALGIAIREEKRLRELKTAVEADWLAAGERVRKLRKAQSALDAEPKSAMGEVFEEMIK